MSQNNFSEEFIFEAQRQSRLASEIPDPDEDLWQNRADLDDWINELAE